MANENSEGTEPQRSAEPFCPIEVSATALSTIQTLYDAGANLQAFQASLAVGPLSRWAGSAAQTLAGRLASNLGGYRLGCVLHWRALRSDPASSKLLAYYGASLLHWRGPLAAFERLERAKCRMDDDDPEGQSYLLTVRADIAALFRDFDAAEDYLSRAVALTPGHPWVAVTRACVLEHEDRFAEALEAARQALRIVPWYRPAVQTTAHLLQVSDRDDEALELLVEAAQRIESLHVVRQLFNLQMDQRLYAAAAENLERMVELAPLMEKAEREWFRRMRVRLDCCLGHRPAALHRAREIDDPYHKALAQRLEIDAPYRNVRLDVPFVRQHHLTCAPATLAAISRFWGQPAEHLEVAEAICYDGTPAHSERHWAETHGWVVREFSVNWDAAVALLERQIPFTLTTSEATSGHLQAVVGFDELQRTLGIRDPFVYGAQDFAIDPLLERYRATGPRGMALVPSHQRSLFDGLNLPDAGLYDQLHAVERSLAEHRRGEAIAVCDRMRLQDQDHRLTLTARRSIAAYDGNIPALLECLESLLRQYPQDGNLNLSRLTCLQNLAGYPDRLRLLEDLCARRGVDPIFWQQYAQALRSGARQLPAAFSWARWALRFRPTDPALLSSWADLLWDEGQFSKAAVHYRLAACLGDKQEGFARSYFVAACHLREAGSALEFLRARNQRLGGRSGAPAITLVESLQHLRQTAEAFQVLEVALARQPQDGSLQLFAADFYGRFSRFEAASRCIEAARDHCPPVAWHRAAALLAQYQSQRPDALRHWREVLQLEPLSHEAIRNVALLLAETQGRPPALAFLDELCQRFPSSCPLLALRVAWRKEDGARAVLPHLRDLIAVNPTDAWAWRELAIQLSQAGDASEALAAADEAIRLEPSRSYGFSIRGDILIQAGKLAEGRTDLRRAVCLEVDNGHALARYVATAPSSGERQEALASVACELRRQVIFGGALHAYQAAARGILPHGEVLTLVREAHGARPDLWQSWSVLTAQLTDAGEHDEALRLALQASEKFPLVPGIWSDLARVEMARLNPPGEIAALEKALEISPSFASASRQLAEVYHRQRVWDKARAVLDHAVAANPLDPENHALLARVLWDEGNRPEAIARLRRALQLEPGLGWGWTLLRDWSLAVGQPGLAADMARELTRSRAGEARSWLMLAACLTPNHDSDSGPVPSTRAHEELFQALDKAIELNPRCEEAFDRRAVVLARLGRFDEALRQCRPAHLDPVPVQLRVRAAWVESLRGNLPGAIVLAEAALRDHPDFYGGWRMLADWRVQAKQLEQAVAAVDTMSALAPLDPVPLGYSGDLKLRLGDRAGAQSAFERAFTLDANYEYAGFQLFDLQLAGKALNQAEVTLQLLERKGCTHHTRSCAVRLAAARRQWKTGLDLLDALFGSLQAETWSVAQAVKALDIAPHHRPVNALLERHLDKGRISPGLAVFWVERQTSRGKWNLHRRLRALKADGETGRRAVLAYLDRLGEAFQRARARKDVVGPLALRFHFQRLLKRHRYWLESDVEGWGKVGYVLTCIGRPGPVITWLSDWRERGNVESWMLYNLVLMLQRKGRYEESRDVILHAVHLRHNQDLYGLFRVWAAFEEALLGRLAEAERHLAGLETSSLEEDAQKVRAMAKLLLDFQRRPVGERPGMSPSLKAGLKASFGKTTPSQSRRYIRAAYRRFIAAVADGGAGFRFRLWGWWFYRQKGWGPTLLFCMLLPLMVAVPPLGIILFVMLASRSQRD